MKKHHISSLNQICLSAIITMSLAIIIGIAILNPLWATLAVPGLFPQNILPPITAPIDGLYYILNADVGYRWSTQDPLSLWFHPLLSYLLKLLPRWAPLNIWFWIISLLFATGCLPLIYRLASIVSGNKQPSAWMLPLCLLAPGGLGMATGNAEIPALFFALGLLLSVLVWQKWWLTTPFAAMAILTKPNGLYMIPILMVYLVAGIMRGNSPVWKQASIGIVVLLVTWLFWIWVVDWKTGDTGVYWKVRLQEKYYLGTGDIVRFFKNLATAYLYTHDLRDQIRYSTALIIPFTSFLIFGLVPLVDDTHRYAMAMGNLAMLATCLYLGNPNKIIVYATTLPGHFVAHSLLVNSIVGKSVSWSGWRRITLTTAYTFYCLAMIVVFIVGTPLRWYH